jgi:cell division protein FtsB
VKVLADTHVAPPLRRWLVRLGLAVVVAIVIGYAPGQLLSRDPRAAKLSAQLSELQAEARELAAGNATLYREVQALHGDVSAIEDRARADLGMVYPDEVVLRVRRMEPIATERPQRPARAREVLAP